MTETNAYVCSIAGQDYVERVCRRFPVVAVLTNLR